MTAIGGGRKARIFGLAACLLFLAAPRVLFGQAPAAPSSERGAKLFAEKGCVQCHAFDGRGGNGAPDLAQRSERAYTPALLASVLWNHGPSMWRLQEQRRIRPTLTAGETADLFAYFYSLLYFSIPGDAARGKVVFEQKNCAGCHAETDTKPGGLAGPPISEWSRVRDPITWAERMWNHSGRMYVEMERAGISWPELSTQNLVDLLVYMRNLPAARSQSAVFQPGDPALGRDVFETRCRSCHTLGTEERRKIDLLRKSQPRALTGYAAAMWNHAPMMRRRSPDGLPTLKTGEMNNLIAYLFAQRYFFEQGDTKRGARIYEVKNCAFCHEQRRQETGAPDLTAAQERFTPITISTAIWSHGPAMFRATQEQGVAWPNFNGSEMTNLIAFLNSRLKF